jgi:hypothetical protein
MQDLELVPAELADFKSTSDAFLAVHTRGPPAVPARLQAVFAGSALWLQRRMAADDRVVMRIVAPVLHGCARR